MQPLAATTTFTIEGYAIREYRWLLRAIVVLSPWCRACWEGSSRASAAGLTPAPRCVGQTRWAAYEQMVQHALLLGANAIVGVCYDGSDISCCSSAATEKLSYGTGVVEPLASGEEPPPSPARPGDLPR